MSILAIDYGAKKIGLAKSDESHSLALPLDVIIDASHSVLLEKLKSICQDYDITQIVVGVPVSFSKGKSDTAGLLRETDLANKQMREVLEFIQWLKANIDLPIVMEDERLSSKMAGEMMKGEMKGQPDDAVAAMLILQSYLDKSKAQSPNVK